MQWILIQPEYSYNVAFPLSLAHVATFLKTMIGEKTLCFDLNLQSLASMVDYLRDNTVVPDVFGFSATSMTKNETLSYCKTLKTLFPEAKTIIGGAAAHVQCLDFLESEAVDFCFTKDIEQIGTTNPTPLSPRALKSLPGIAYLEDNKNKTNPAGPLTDLESFPFPLRDLDFIQIEKYHSPNVIRDHNLATLVTSRGCPHNCTYCASSRISGQKTIWRSATSVIEELEYLRRLGYNNFIFEDYEFLFNIERAERICKDLEKNACKWILKTRVENISAKTARMLADSGCQVVYIGVETLTQKAIEAAKKATVNVESVKRAVAHLKKNNIRICASTQFGLPGDTEEEFLNNTMRFLANVLDHNKDMVQLHFTTLFPGTELHEKHIHEAVYLNIHPIFSHVVAHGFEGPLMPGLSEDVIKRIYERSSRILGNLLTEKGIWFSH